MDWIKLSAVDSWGKNRSKTVRYWLKLIKSYKDKSVIHLLTACWPDHDFVNDALTIYFAFPTIISSAFIVYDRWGALLYNHANFVLSSGESLWDSQRNGPAGMYVYRLDCPFPDGTPVTYRQSVALLYRLFYEISDCWSGQYWSRVRAYPPQCWFYGSRPVGGSAWF
ncbi:T9SS type B sorting domain-containing protein [Spirosoma humi]